MRAHDKFGFFGNFFGLFLRLKTALPKTTLRCCFNLKRSKTRLMCKISTTFAAFEFLTNFCLKFDQFTNKICSICQWNFIPICQRYSIFCTSTVLSFPQRSFIIVIEFCRKKVNPLKLFHENAKGILINLKALIWQRKILCQKKNSLSTFYSKS